MTRFWTTIVALVAAVAAASAPGCKKEESTPNANPPARPGGTAAGGTPAATQPKKEKDEHPNAVPLGTTTAGGMTLAAVQDEPIRPGGDGAFDLKVTGYPAGGKPKAVRFWVGVESGDGSAKAKAEEESPDVWHTHVEVPGPLPAGSKFWAEVEPAAGEKVKVAFDLKG